MPVITKEVQMPKRRPSPKRRVYYYDFSGIIPRKKYRYEKPISDLQRFLPIFVLLGTVGLCIGLDLSTRIPEVIAVQPKEVIEDQDIPVREVWEHGPTQEQTLELPLQEYPEEEPTIDMLVGEAIDFYFESTQHRSEARMIMHCLLHRESTHGVNKGHGDNGMAGGILQYWEDTWTGYRKLMIDQGYAEEISTRYNEADAIYTTVWALKTNRGKAWGPIYRELTNYQFSNKPGCPVPSWSRSSWK